ncbi:MAG: antibiotic biosynthesis monooxygenase [Bacteroidota bacterium]
MSNVLSVIVLLSTWLPIKDLREEKLHQPEETILKKTFVIEVTRFRAKEGTDDEAFTKRDAEIEEDYTSKQPGFIRRESAQSEDGEWLVVVYWEDMESASASMQKFMGDASVADYAGMIDGATMKMKRFMKEGKVDATKNALPYVIEVTTLTSNKEIEKGVFAKRDAGVEKDYTSKQPGFIARESAQAEDGEWVVVVYWKTLEDANASMQKFMGDASVADYAAMIDSQSMAMARFSAKN